MKRLLLTLAILAAGCTEEVTEVIVVVDSDLTVPEELGDCDDGVACLDTITIDITGPTGTNKKATARLTGDRAVSLPTWLGVVHRGGPLEPLVVFVEGSYEGLPVIQRRARTTFVEGEIRVLRMDLWAACVGERCAPDHTCANPQGECLSEEVPADQLGEWTGQPEGGDGGSPPMDGGDGGLDAGPEACVPMEEICNERDDDCDGMVDEGFDLGSDPDHCGSCGNVCPLDPPNAFAACTAGECDLACDPGWADCDGDPMTGCETLLSTPETCGDCDTVCPKETEPLCSGDPSTGFACVASCDTTTTTQCGESCVVLSINEQHCGACDDACPTRPHAVPVCTVASCSYACDPGWHDCDAVADNGCESQLKSLTNCGACGTTCDLPNAMESCVTGTCIVVGCEAGFGDCGDDVGEEGCEANLTNDTMNCGTCGNACPADPANASSTCVDGACVVTCDPGFADCDADLSNGCESNLSSKDTCGSCGIRCSSDSAPVCASDGSGGFTCVSGCSTGERLCSGSCVDTSTDPSNCGSCGNICPDRPSSAPTCSGGRCGILCDSGYGDCDGDPSNGCEKALNTTSDCGSCGTPCNLTNASESCTTGTCTLTACDSGFGNCDGDPSNGCETSLTTNTFNCGSCGNVCPSSAPNASGSRCVSGSCVLTCNSGWANCNGDLSDGCETPLTTLSDCGACGVTCTRDHATPTCSDGTCRIAACDDGWGNCDGVDANGCETNTDTSDSHCGGCGVSCGLSASCCGGGCCPDSRACCVGVCCDTGEICRMSTMTCGVGS